MSGRSPLDGRFDEARLRQSAAALDVDVLALQEVDRQQPRTDHADITAVVAQGCRAVAARFAPTLVGTPGERWVAAGADTGTGPADRQPQYGVALVSRWPVRSWHERRFGPAPVRAPIMLPGPRSRIILLADEPRVVLAAVLEGPTGPLTVACTHLSFVPGWNVGQLLRTLRWLRHLPAPRYLLGDLNLPLSMTEPLAAAAGWRLLGRRPTYPAARPRVQLDHVLTDARPGPSGLTVRRVATPVLPISDHRPLVVELSGSTAGGELTLGS